MNKPTNTPSKEQPKPSTMVGVFNDVAKRAGKQTILQAQPTGEYLIWMTAHETDPIAALLSAAMSIMIRRGEQGVEQKGISIRKVSSVVVPGYDFFWKVTDRIGNEIAHGYAASEDQAALDMMPYVSKIE